MRKNDLYPFAAFVLLFITKLIVPIPIGVSQLICYFLLLITMILGIIIYRPEEYQSSIKVNLFAILCSLSYTTGIIAILANIWNYENAISLFWEIPNIIFLVAILFLQRRARKIGSQERVSFYKSLVIRSFVLLLLCLSIMMIPFYIINLNLNSDTPFLYNRGLAVKYENQAIELSKEGKFDEALAFANMSMKAYRIGWPGESSFPACRALYAAYNGLLRKSYEEGNYDMTLKYAGLIDRPLKACYGDTSDEAADIKVMVGLAYEFRKKYDMSDSLLSQALSYYSTNGNKGRKYNLMGSLATSYRNRANYNESNVLLKAIIKELTDSIETMAKPSDTIEIRNSISHFYSEIGYSFSCWEKYDSAEVYFKKCFEVKSFEKSPEYAKALSNCAHNMYNKGDYHTAKTTMEMALHVWPQEGRSDYDYVFAVLGLNSVNISLANYKEAEQGCYKAIEALEKITSNKSHVYYVEMIFQLAQVKYYQADYDTAKLLLQEALSYVDPKSYKHAEIMEVLSALNADLALYTVADGQAREATNVAIARLGRNDDPSLSVFFRNEGYMDYLLENIKLSESLYLRCVALDSNKKFRGRIEFAATLDGLGLVRTSQRKFREADMLFDTVLIIYSLLLGENHPDYATALYNKACLNLAEADLSEAEALFNKSLEIRKKVIGDKHDKVADDLVGLGEIRLQKGNIPDALKYFMQAQDIYRSKFNDDHKKVILTAKYIDQCKRKS